MFEQVRLKSPSDQIAEQVRMLIAKGRLKPGQRLPAEREMATMLGVGRQAVRGALNKLALAGLVQVMPSQGAFVRSLTPVSLRSPLGALLESGLANMFEFMEVRKVLEAWCAEEAARRTDPAKLKRVEASLALMEEAIREGRSVSRADIEFHAAIAEAAENTILLHIMDTFTTLLHSTERFRNLATDASNVGTYLAEHRAIYEAIKAGDPQEARRRMRAHLETVTSRVKDVLGKTDGSALGDWRKPVPPAQGPPGGHRATGKGRGGGRRPGDRKERRR